MSGIFCALYRKKLNFCVILTVYFIITNKILIIFYIFVVTK